MAKRRKSESREVSEVLQKIAGMKAIDPKLDLGNGVSVTALEDSIEEFRAALAEYNSTLAVADEKLNVVKAKERAVTELGKKVLPAVGLKYGTDSSEYEQVGGTRDSDRARPVRRLKSSVK
jgi:hypothetical protein